MSARWSFAPLLTMLCFLCGCRSDKTPFVKAFNVDLPCGIKVVQDSLIETGDSNRIIYVGLLIGTPISFSNLVQVLDLQLAASVANPNGTAVGAFPQIRGALWWTPPTAEQQSESKSVYGAIVKTSSFYDKIVAQRAGNNIYLYKNGRRGYFWQRWTGIRGPWGGVNPLEGGSSAPSPNEFQQPPVTENASDDGSD